MGLLPCLSSDRKAIQPQPWLLALLAVVLAHGVLAAATSGEPSGYAAWPLWVLVLFCLFTVVLSAMYCGLTIGLLGMETIYLEIIADAGQEPDRTYAQQILPVRKLGHQLLSTLLLGNMLTLVLTSQLVAAIVNSTEIVNFILGTLVVLIFGELIPMSFCNNQNNALFAGAKSLPALKVSLFVLWPIAKPLGLMLDCMVGHEAGQVYDRKELKKLIRLHCEKFSDKSGIDKDQVRMMLSAMDMNEVTVDAAMTPINKAVMLEADAPLDIAVEHRLWEYGISRIPVYQKTRDHIIGVLYVKDLISVSYLGRHTRLTVRDFLVEHPRDVLVVTANTLLQDILHIFEHRHTQLLFVEPCEEGETSTTPSSSPAAATAHAASHHLAEASLSVSKRPVVTPAILTPVALLTDSTEKRSFLGIITLEDVIEELIASEIYDEDEYKNDVSVEEVFDTGAIASAPVRLPRVNFYSYSVSSNKSDGENQLEDDQLWALASYMTRAYVSFATWSVPHVKFLLDQVGSTIVRVEAEDNEQANTSTQNDASITAVAQSDLSAIDPSRLLYRAGQPARVFTLLLSGGIAVSIGRDHIGTELRSFSDLAEEVLLSDGPFVPDYTAVVSRTSRLVRISPADVVTAEGKVNAWRERRRQNPVRLQPSARAEVMVQPPTTPSCRKSVMRGEDSRVTIE